MMGDRLGIVVMGSKYHFAQEQELSVLFENKHNNSKCERNTTDTTTGDNGR